MFLIFAMPHMPRADVWCEAMGAASKDWQIAVGLFQAMADGQGNLRKPLRKQWTTHKNEED